MHHTIYNKATFNKSDGAVAGLIGTITDVTGLKEAEAALREGEARFRDLTELSSDWYWEQDADLRFTQISSRVHEFALGSEEDIGKARWEIPRLHMTDEQWQPHKAVLAARRSFQDFVYQRYDVYGNLRIISVSGRPIFDEAGRFQGYRGTGRDITEQKRAEEQIRHMAHYDALTELPNRMLLHDRIGQAIAQAQRNQEVLAHPVHRPRPLQDGQRLAGPRGRRPAAARRSPGAWSPARAVPTRSRGSAATSSWCCSATSSSPRMRGTWRRRCSTRCRSR